MTQPVPIQLALQGGGARITHLLAALHAVQELERENVLRVTRIAGTSAGALAGALYAARVDMGRARDVLLAEREALLRAFPASGATLRDAWRVLARRPLWNAEPLRQLMARLLSPRETFRDLDLPLVVLAADLTNLQSVVYGRPDDPLLSSLLDSAAVPFLFRAVPRRGEDYRVVVDGGVCDNLPSEQLADSPADGEVLGITFSVPRAGAPLATFSDYLRALVETAINASVLRAQLQLGLNAFVIRAATRSFDFRGAIEAAAGAEYRETQLLAEAHFRAYAERTARARSRVFVEDRQSCLSGQTRLSVLHTDAASSLRRMYEHRHEPVHFEFLSIRMIVTGASHASSERRGPDHVRHEIVFRATTQPLHCYRIQLAPGHASELHRTHCEIFDVDGDPVPFDVVPLGESWWSGAREYLLFFGTPVVPGDPRAPLTLRVRDALTDGLRLARDGRDELVVRASRADGPIGRIELVAHLPEELSDTRVVAAPSSEGARMAPAELLGYAAPAGYFTLGWKGEDVPPNTLFGCNLIRR